jgi:hypothetical protein
MDQNETQELDARLAKSMAEAKAFEDAPDPLAFDDETEEPVAAPVDHRPALLDLCELVAELVSQGNVPHSQLLDLERRGAALLERLKEFRGVI